MSCGDGAAVEKTRGRKQGIRNPRNRDFTTTTCVIASSVSSLSSRRSQHSAADLSSILTSDLNQTDSSKFISSCLLVEAASPPSEDNQTAIKNWLKIIHPQDLPLDHEAPIRHSASLHRRRQCLCHTIKKHMQISADGSVIWC